MSEFDRDDMKPGMTGRTVREDAEKVASDAYSAAKTTADDVMDEAMDQGEQLVETVSDYVATRPLLSIGIAAAVGFLLAKITR